MESYYQKLKDLANQPIDVENLVTESRLVLQMVRGLPPEFDGVGAYINQSSPSWETTDSMLQLEQHRQTTRQSQAQTVIDTPVSVDQSSQNPVGTAQGNRNQPSDHYSSNRQQLNSGRDRGGNGPGRGRNSRGRGGRGQR